MKSEIKNNSKNKNKREVYVKPVILEEEKLTTYTLTCNPPGPCGANTVVSS